jgi:energy-coupling factor transporter ATP-binding protein EcfA2
VPVPIAPTAVLRAELDRLVEVVESIRFDLPSVEQPARRHRRDRVATLVRRYLEPRLSDPDMPLLVVLFGPTGGGKSTVLNSLAGGVVSEPGPLRPTTRRPVVLAHARHRSRYQALAADGGAELVASDHPTLEWLTLVDTPDVDSYLDEHRSVAEAMLEAADVAVLVTTPQRYADAVPREVLAPLVERGAEVLHVMNRMRRGTDGAVADYVRSLGEEGLAPAGATRALITIREQRLRSGLVPAAGTRRLADRLTALASARDRVVEEVTAGAVAWVAASANRLATDLDRQEAEARALVDVAQASYRTQRDVLVDELRRGSLVRDEVVDRWRRLVGVSDLAAVVAGTAGRVRGLFGGPRPAEADLRRVGEEARRELAARIGRAADRAANATAAAWELDPAGRSLLTPELRRPGPGMEATVDEAVGDWLVGLADLVRAEGKSSFRVARLASIGVNAIATTLLLGVFVQTGGLTGAELGVAAGAAAAQQSLLEHLFGRATAGRLAGEAISGLVAVVDEVLIADAARFESTVRSVVDPIGSAGRVAEAAGRVGSAAGWARG